MKSMGKGLVIAGAVILVIGLIIWLSGDKLRWLGRLPGDIRIERENFRLYIPLATMLLLSLLLTAIMWIIQRFR
ncbi:MAG: DUF2905 domain-containing protein [Sphingobacteriales bacterium]|nr:MAG: DUF2905 domain-containing protein [Sphingobacteriales bacterium]